MRFQKVFVTLREHPHFVLVNSALRDRKLTPFSANQFSEINFSIGCMVWLGLRL